MITSRSWLGMVSVTETKKGIFLKGNERQLRKVLCTHLKEAIQPNHV